MSDPVLEPVENPLDRLNEEERAAVDKAIANGLPGWEVDEAPPHLSTIRIAEAVSPSLAELLRMHGLEIEPHDPQYTDSPDIVFVPVRTVFGNDETRLHRMAQIDLTSEQVIALG